MNDDGSCLYDSTAVLGRSVTYQKGSPHGRRKRAAASANILKAKGRRTSRNLRAVNKKPHQQ